MTMIIKGIEPSEIFDSDIDHPDYAILLSSLATYNSNIGNYAKSIRLGTEAMEKDPKKECFPGTK